MFETIDNNTLDQVTGGMSSSTTMMLLLMAILGKRKPGGGFNINDEGKKKLFDLFKSSVEKTAKPAEASKPAETKPADADAKK